MRNDRRLLLLLLSLALPTGCGGGGAGDDAGTTPSTLRVLTRNIYYGADLGPAIGAVNSGDPDAIVAAVTQVRADLEATEFPLRAQALALEIEQQQPDLVGLQEAALWRVQSPSDTFTADPTPAADVAYDFVALLVQALADRGLSYDVVVISEGFDVEFPYVDANLELADLRLTDREVILARGDLAERGFALENAQAGTFGTNLELANGFEALRGWAAVDVREGARRLRFVTTHLEAEVPEIRNVQAEELAFGPLMVDFDIVLVGDMNDDALAPDADGAYGWFASLGLRDAWLEAPTQGVGATCCFDALLADASAPLTERLDLVLVRGGLSAVAAQVLGAHPAARVGGLWPSDHAGLAATLQR